MGVHLNTWWILSLHHWASAVPPTLRYNEQCAPGSSAEQWFSQRDRCAVTKEKVGCERLCESERWSWVRRNSWCFFRGKATNFSFPGGCAQKTQSLPVCLLCLYPWSQCLKYGVGFFRSAFWFLSPWQGNCCNRVFWWALCWRLSKQCKCLWIQ